MHLGRRVSLQKQRLIEQLESFTLDGAGCRLESDRDFIYEAVKQWYPDSGGLLSSFFLESVSLPKMAGTVGGGSPAPPNKPWNDDSSVNINKAWVSHGFKVVQDFVQPQNPPIGGLAWLGTGELKPLQ